MIAVTALLEPEGVRSFCDPYYQLLGCIERKIAAGAGRQQTQHPRPRCPGNAQSLRPHSARSST